MLKRKIYRKYRLVRGDEVLRASYWRTASNNELQMLIRRFAVRENACRQRGKPTFYWRNRRLAAVREFERRFMRVPDLFRNSRLEPMESYYVHEGTYLWPIHGEPGRPIFDVD